MHVFGLHVSESFDKKKNPQKYENYVKMSELSGFGANYLFTVLPLMKTILLINVSFLRVMMFFFLLLMIMYIMQQHKLIQNIGSGVTDL